MLPAGYRALGVGSEGGPLLLADVAAFAHWTGSEPFAGEPTGIHYWGTLLALLPERFATPPYGHHYLDADDPQRLGQEVLAHALALPGACEESLDYRGRPTRGAVMRAIRRAVRRVTGPRRPPKLLPGRSTDVLLTDGRFLRVELQPSCAYDSLLRAFDARTDYVVPHMYPVAGRGVLVWNVEAGVPDVVVSPDGSAITLFESHLDEPEHEAVRDEAAAAAGAHPIRGAPQSAGPDLDLPSGLLVVCWSPQSAAETGAVSMDLPRPESGPVAPEKIVRYLHRLASIAAAPVSLGGGGIDGSGVLISVPPGTYRSLAGYGSGSGQGDWHWCTLIGPSGVRGRGFESP